MISFITIEFLGKVLRWKGAIREKISIYDVT